MTDKNELDYETTREILENQRLILKALGFLIAHKGERVLVNLSEKNVLRFSIDDRQCKTTNLLSKLSDNNENKNT